MSSTELPYRLRIPGPCPVPERVRRAMSEIELNHRGPEFKAIVAEVQTLIRPLFGTSGDVLLFGSSGTGVMEASLVNILAPGERVLVAMNGQFSERMQAIAAGLGAVVDTVDFEWGQAVAAVLVARQLERHDYRAVLVVHNESATGALSDLAPVGRALAGRPTLLVVDTVSALGAAELRQDDWQVDIAFAASQKALMCPPGLGLVSLSAKAWRVVERNDGLPRFYWDFRRARASLEKNETPFTPPTTLVGGLREALRMIHEEGVPQVLARHHRLAQALRAGCGALGLRIFTEPQALSPSVTALHVPAGLDGNAFVRHMREKYRTVIAGVRPARLNGKVIRLSTMGHVSEADILTDLDHLERSLGDFGRPVDAGAGVTVASAVLRT